MIFRETNVTELNLPFRSWSWAAITPRRRAIAFTLIFGIRPGFLTGLRLECLLQVNQTDCMYNYDFYSFTRYRFSCVVWNNFLVRLSPTPGSSTNFHFEGILFETEIQYYCDDKQKISSSQTNSCVLIFPVSLNALSTNGVRIRPPFYNGHPPFCVLTNAILIS